MHPQAPKTPKASAGGRPAKSRWDIPMMDGVGIPPGVRKALAALLGAYALACAALWLAEPSIIFHPMPAAPGAAPASTHGSASYRLFPASKALPWERSICEGAPGRPALAVAYFAGNAEPASSVGRIAREKLPGCPVYALSYPGYEGAPGSPSEASIDQAADDMAEAMAADGFAPERVVLVGRSLGSGVAARQAALRPCRHAALLTPYDSLDKVASDSFPWAPARLLMRDRFDTAPYAPIARCGATVVFADRDEVIAPHHAVELAKSWNKAHRSTLGSNSRATHGNIADLDSTWDSIGRDMREGEEGP